MNKKLPKLIELCPIVDAIMEIRFKTQTHSNAVFGIIYSKLSTEFKNVENLPILQIPEPIRNSDPSLKSQPLYKIFDDEFVIQIGPEVLSISSYPTYVGWKRFSNKINSILDKIEELKIITQVDRLGIRYINFFEQNIFNKINLNINLSGKEFNDEISTFRTQVTTGKFISTLQISNDATSNDKRGSIIDIDCHKTTGLQDFFRNKKELINEGHLKEKELFFSILSDDFLNELKPKY